MKMNFKTNTELIPAIIQDDYTQQVLMLGYMNEEAYQKTIETKLVTFFSRSKNRLWVKGETSSNYLHVVSIFEDCDEDTILIRVNPNGPTCHNGTISCFEKDKNRHFLYSLERIISERINQKTDDSYTYKLFEKGVNKVAQKVGEEAVELVIESKDDNIELFKNEAADLLYHFLILLKSKKTSLNEIEQVLLDRNT